MQFKTEDDVKLRMIELVVLQDPASGDNLFAVLDALNSELQGRFAQNYKLTKITLTSLLQVTENVAHRMQAKRNANRLKIAEALANRRAE